MIQGRKPRYGKKRWGNFDMPEIVHVSNHLEDYTRTYLIAVFHAARKRKGKTLKFSQEERFMYSLMAKKIQLFLLEHPKLETSFRKYTLKAIARKASIKR